MNFKLYICLYLEKLNQDTFKWNLKFTKHLMRNPKYLLTCHHDVNLLAEYRPGVVLRQTLVRSGVLPGRTLDLQILTGVKVPHRDTVLQPPVHWLRITCNKNQTEREKKQVLISLVQFSEIDPFQSDPPKFKIHSFITLLGPGVRNGRSIAPALIMSAYRP